MPNIKLLLDNIARIIKTKENDVILNTPPSIRIFPNPIGIWDQETR